MRHLARAVSRPSLRAALLAALAGCGGAEADSAVGGATVTDSAGVRVVTHPAPGGAAPRRLPEPSLRVGEPAVELTHVAGAVALEDGGVAVADGGASRIYLVAADGRVRATLGGSGKGPGEFAVLAGLRRLPGDSLIAWDQGQLRLTVFAPDGRVARVARPTSLPVGLGARMRGTLPGSGVLLESGTDIMALMESSAGVMRLSHTLLRYGPDGVLADTAAVVPGREVSVHRKDPSVTWMDVPYGPGSHVAVAGGRMWLTSGEPYRLEARDPGTGRLLAVVRRPAPPRPVTRDDLRRAREAIAAADPKGVEDPESRKVLDEVPRRAAMAPVTALAADDRGRVWVREAVAAGEPDVRWAVYGADGGLVEEWLLPAGLEVMEIVGGRLVGVLTGEADVPEVVVFRLDG